VLVVAEEHRVEHAETARREGRGEVLAAARAEAKAVGPYRGVEGGISQPAAAADLEEDSGRAYMGGDDPHMARGEAIRMHCRRGAVDLYDCAHLHSFGDARRFVAAERVANGACDREANSACEQWMLSRRCDRHRGRKLPVARSRETHRYESRDAQTLVSGAPQLSAGLQASSTDLYAPVSLPRVCLAAHRHVQ
jgi:hypothetical protein